MRPVPFLLVAFLLTALLPLAPTAVALGPAPSEAGGKTVVAEVLYDAAAVPPMLNVTFWYDTATYVPTHRWHVPEGARVVKVLDDKEKSLAESTEGGYSEVNSGYGARSGVRAIRWFIEMPALEPAAAHFRTGEVSIAGSDTQVVKFAVKAPPGEAWLDATPSKAALASFTGPQRPLLLFGAAAEAVRTEPASDASKDIVKRYSLDVNAAGVPSLTVTSWANSSKWNLALPHRVPTGWRISAASDAWGSLPVPTVAADGAFRVAARDLPGRIAETHVRFVPDTAVGAYPLVTVSVPADDEDSRHHVRVTVPEAHREKLAASRAALVDGATHPVGKGFHATYDRGLPGWSSAAAGPFRITGAVASEVEFAAVAAERAAKPVQEAFGRAGFTLRDEIPVVILPDGHPAFKSPWEAGHFTAEGWGVELKQGAVRNDSLDGTPWPLAALFLHETFHVGQRDFAPGASLSWWIEGTAEEARRAFPASAICPGHVKYKGDDCVPQRLPTPQEIDRYEAGEFDIAWDEHGHVPDPGFAYAMSNFLVKAYRERAGDEAYRAVWADLAKREGCCTVAELTAILRAHASSLSRADIEQPFLALRSTNLAAYNAAIDDMLEFDPWPGTAPEPPMPLTVRFGWEPESPVAANRTSFKGTATGGSGGVTEWRWDFGDGTTSDGSPLVGKTFGRSGSFRVSLEVVDAVGNRAAVTHDVGVQPEPLAVSFTASATEPVAGSPVRFTPQVSGDEGRLTFTWSFGGGAISTEAAPSFAFPGPGTVNVTLAVKDGLGRVSSASKNLQVAARAPVPEIAVTRDPLDRWNVTFASVGADVDRQVLKWEWRLSDGQVKECTAATCLAAETFHLAPGSHTVTLTLHAVDGETYTTSTIVQVPKATDPLPGEQPAGTSGAGGAKATPGVAALALLGVGAAVALAARRRE